MYAFFAIEAPEEEKMSEVKIDFSKLLGFRLLGDQAGLVLGEKVGGKEGVKVGKPLA